ncbi:MAG: PD-(D/E)XK nuclease-like domain-containing protein [Ruminococcus sp.]
MSLNNENYFSLENQMKYMGVSQFKAFEDCQASAFAEVTGNFEREVTTSLLVGSYVDAHFEGSLDIFKAKHPEIFTKKGDLKAEYRKADEIINRVEQDELFMHYMSGEKQVIMTGSVEGVPVKIKIDSYHPDKMIVDLKCMKDFAPIYIEEKGRLNFIEAWRYDLQGAVYQEIVRQNTGKQLPFYIAAVTKERVPDIAVIEIPQSYLDVELEHFKKNIQFYDGIKHGIFPAERCEHCDYCKETKVLHRPVSLEELEFE